jgi:hypothetical protein
MAIFHAMQFARRATPILLVVLILGHKLIEMMYD